MFQTLKNIIFYFYLSACRHIKIRNNLMDRFCEIYFWIFGPKNVPFPKNPNSYFYPFFNAYHQVQFQKNLIYLEEMPKASIFVFQEPYLPIFFIIKVFFKNPKESPLTTYQSLLSDLETRHVHFKTCAIEQDTCNWTRHVQLNRI